MINNNINPTLDYLIDDAYPFDITGIFSLYNQYFTKNEKYPSEIKKKMNNSEEIMLVSREDSNKVLGFIGSSIDFESKQLWINYFAVDKNFQKQGIGKEMLLQIANDVKAEEINEIVLLPYNKTNAKTYYDALGFKKINTQLLYIRTDQLIKKLEN